jgi:hypothetical protein
LIAMTALKDTRYVIDKLAWMSSQGIWPHIDCRGSIVIAHGDDLKGYS